MNTHNMKQTLQAATQLHQQGMLKEALSLYQSLANENGDASVYYLMGNCLAQMQQFDQAIAVLNKSMVMDNSREDLFLNLAICQEEAGHLADAIKTLEQALPRFPLNKRFHNRYGDIQLTLGNAQLAASHFQKAIELDHNFLPAYINLAKAYEKLDQFESGVEILGAARNVSEDPVIINNLANLLRQRSEYTRARQLLQQNISKGVLLSESFHNLALLEQDLGKFSAARQYYQQSIEYNPHNLLSQWNNLLLDLMLGNWNDALDRYRIGKQIGIRPSLPKEIQEWNGEDLHGKSLLIFHEQGVGEEVLFSSVYHLLPAGQAQITALCDPRLATIFSRSFPQIRFIRKDKTNVLANSRFDYGILAGDLPWILNVTSQGKLHTSGFLSAENHEARVVEHKTGPKRIGLSWRGGKNEHERRKRSLLIGQLKALLKTESYTFINLQHDISEDELNFLRTTAHQLEEHPETDLKNDFEQLASLISSLDAVVCCTNTISHLAGALNIPTYVLTPVSPTWYRLASGTTTPWYPNMHLIRQSKLSSWDHEITEAINCLEKQFS